MQTTLSLDAGSFCVVTPSEIPHRQLKISQLKSRENFIADSCLMRVGEDGTEIDMKELPSVRSEMSLCTCRQILVYSTSGKRRTCGLMRMSTTGLVYNSSLSVDVDFMGF